jgi:hypothetical protein
MSSAGIAPKKKRLAKSKETVEQKVEEVIENVGIDSSELIEEIVESILESKVESILESKVEPIVEPIVETIIKPIVEEVLGKEVIEKLNIDTSIIQNIIPVGRSLVEIIDEEIKQKSMILNKDYVDVINILIKKSPELFGNIEKSIYEIMKDGKVDSNDIPHLIKIIQKLYEGIFTIKSIKLSNEKQTAICSELIKNVFKIMIKERKIKLELNKQEQFLEQFNKLIESCTSLLSFQKILKSKGCFSSLFGKK